MTKEALSPASDLTGLILDSITEGVFTVDREFNVLSFNKAAERITGMSARAVIGRKCYDVLRSGLCQQKCALRESMRTGRPLLEMDGEITTATGDLVPVRIRTAVLRGDEGQILGGVETFRDRSEVQHLVKRITEAYTFCDIKGKSDPMVQLFAIIPEVARSGATVLITGESGTGKELVARAVHDLSKVHEGPFVAVNCGSIPETLMESELFGHKRGAFTGADRDRPGRFAAAQGGTLFLDEVGELPPALQAKLLRALDQGEYTPLGANLPQKATARVVAATNRDLEQDMNSGRFRQDLYYRLNVLRLHLPPLRQRREDIPLLTGHFLERLAAERGEPKREMAPAAMSLLMDYRWPGNVRELQNALEHALVVARGGEIEPRHLPESIRRNRDLSPGGAGRLGSLDLAERESQAVRAALRRHGGHRARAAAELGISTTTLWRKIKKYGLMDLD